MLASEKIDKAITYVEQALKELENGNKRLAVGDLDYAKESIMSSIYILISEIEDEEGKF